MSASGSSDGSPQFSHLWPTQFLSLRLPGNETANPVLADFVLAQNVQNDDMTVDYTADNIFITDHPALIWLRNAVTAPFWIMHANPALPMILNGCCKGGRMSI